MIRNSHSGDHAVIVMAQGRQERLPELPIPKQLVPIAGAPLLERTIAQVRASSPQYHLTVIAPVTMPWLRFCQRLAIDQVPLQNPGETLLAGIAQTASLWRTTTTILLGDVVFSRAALQLALEESALRFVGRLGPNSITGCPWGELFSVTFDRSLWGDLRLAMPSQGKLWTLCYHYAGKPPRAPSFVAIDPNDYSDDIDTPDDLAAVGALEKAIASDL